jgi:predicted DNA-binding mobile mystery protein A
MDAKFKALRPLLQVSRPAGGWIRSIRQALGMTTRDLALRIGRSQQTVFALEKSEAENKINLETLAQVAEGLDCTVVYALIPRLDLETAMRRQAEKIANRLLGKVSKSMELEAQGLESEKSKAQAEQLVEELLVKPPRPFWR